MALLGVKTLVNASGTSTATAAEPCTFVSGANPNKVYQITNTAKRIIDPSVAIVVKDGGTPVSNTLYQFNFLYGIITFVGYTQTGAITVDGNYLPLVAAVEAKEINWSRERVLIDSTVFKTSDVYRTRLAETIATIKGTLKFLSWIGTDLDVGTGGEQSWETFFSSGAPKLLDCDLGSNGLKFRAWILFPKEANSAVVTGGLVEGSIDFEGTGIGTAAGIAALAANAGMGWGS